MSCAPAPIGSTPLAIWHDFPFKTRARKYWIFLLPWKTKIEGPSYMPLVRVLAFRISGILTKIWAYKWFYWNSGKWNSVVRWTKLSRSYPFPLEPFSVETFQRSFLSINYIPIPVISLFHMLFNSNLLHSSIKKIKLSLGKLPFNWEVPKLYTISNHLLWNIVNKFYYYCSGAW